MRVPKYLTLATLLAVTPLFGQIGAAAGAEPSSIEPAAVEQADAERLLASPSELIRWLEQHSPRLHEAKQAAAVTRSEIAVAGIHPNPALLIGVASYAIGQTNPSGLSRAQTPNLMIGYSQPILLGKLGLRQSAARQRSAAADSGVRQSLVDVAAASRDALGVLSATDARVVLLTERLADAEHVAALGRLRLERGDISGIDQDRLELERLSVARQLNGAEADHASAQAECEAWLGARCSALRDLSALVSAPLLEGRGPAQQQVDARPDVLALGHAAQAAQTDAQLARRTRVPDPTVTAMFTRDYLTVAGNQPYTLGLALTIPLPVFDAGSRQAARSEAERAAYQAEASRIRRESIARVTGLVQTERQLIVRLKQLEEESLPRSSATVKAAESAFHHGQTGMTELLMMRREHLAIALELIDTRLALFQNRNALRHELALDAYDPFTRER